MVCASVPGGFIGMTSRPLLVFSLDQWEPRLTTVAHAHALDGHDGGEFTLLQDIS